MNICEEGETCMMYLGKALRSLAIWGGGGGWGRGEYKITQGDLNSCKVNLCCKFFTVVLCINQQPLLFAFFFSF